MPSGTAPVAMERLRELTAPELYQRNAFRLTGLPTAATRRTIRQRRQHITTAARAGVPLPGGELPVPGRRSAEQYGAAFDVIDHPQRRIVDELFWLWDSPEGACGCDPALHRVHDAAVRAHARALDEELAGGAAPAEGEGGWGAAAAGWRAALDHTGFWDHLRHRVTVLDDRRLDPSALPVLEREVRRTLVAPLAALAAGAQAPRRVLGLFGAWSWAGQGLLDEAVEQRLRPDLDSARLALQRARELWEKNAARAVSVVEKEVVPHLTRLRAFDTGGIRQPVRRLCDRTALLLNNCVISGGGPPLPAGEDLRLLELALALAETEQTRELVTSNRKYLAVGSATKSLDSAGKLLARGKPEQAAARLREQVVPQIAELRGSEDGEKRQIADRLADSVALLLNNCAVALSSGPSSGGSAPGTAQDGFRLLDEAAELARTRRTRRLVKRNRRRFARSPHVGPYKAVLDAIRSGLTSAQESLGRGKPDEAAKRIEKRVVPRLEELRTGESWTLRRLTALLSDRTAVLLNNCAVALRPEGSAPAPRSFELLDLARTLAVKRRTRRLIGANSDSLRYAEILYPTAPPPDQLRYTPPPPPSLLSNLFPGHDGDQLSDLPPSVRTAVLRLPPDQRADFLTRYRNTR